MDPVGQEAFRRKGSVGRRPWDFAHRTGKFEDRVVGGPGSLLVKRSAGSPPSGGRPSGSRRGKMERSIGPGSPRVKRFGGAHDLRVTLSNEPGRAETERSTGSSCFRAAGSTGWGSSGHRNNGRNAWKRIGPGGVRRALRSTLQGPRVQAPGVSTYFSTRLFQYCKTSMMCSQRVDHAPPVE